VCTSHSAWQGRHAHMVKAPTNNGTLRTTLHCGTQHPHPHPHQHPHVHSFLDTPPRTSSRSLTRMHSSSIIFCCSGSAADNMRSAAAATDSPGSACPVTHTRTVTRHSHRHTQTRQENKQGGTRRATGAAWGVGFGERDWSARRPYHLPWGQSSRAQNTLQREGKMVAHTGPGREPQTNGHIE
jgi:hypothetical protein